MQPTRRSNQFLRAKELGIDNYGYMSNEAKCRIGKKNTERGHTEETKQKLSKIAKERGLGGHTSKQKLYFLKKNGSVVYLQSSYEVKFATLLENMDIEWERPLPLPWVDVNGINHKYYPDFKIGNIYFDTKNDYLAIVDADKILRVAEQNGVDVRIVRYNQISEEFLKMLL